MLKYDFLVYHKDYEKFLDKLQNKGVMDIILNEEYDEEKALLSNTKLQQYNQMIAFLKTFKEKHDPKLSISSNPNEILDSYESLKAEHENLKSKITQLEKDIVTLEPWGDFDFDKLTSLESYGLEYGFCSSLTKVFQSLPKDIISFEIHQHHGQSHFIIFHDKNKDLDFKDVEFISLPDISLKEAIASLEQLRKKEKEIEETYLLWAKSVIPQLKEARDQLQSKQDFKQVFSDSKKEAEDNVRVLSGWIPANKEKQINSFLNKENILFLSRRAVPEDPKIPILLANNRFARLFEPIGGLFSMPDYKELDMTPFFAPFFMLFFGFCLGDAGYGIIYIIIATILKLKTEDPAKRRLFSLIQFLGGSTIFFGIITGTFFGVSLLNIQWLGSLKSIILESNSVFNLALIIGLIQIYFGIVLRAANQIRQFGFAYGLSPIGWLLLIPFGLDFAFTHYTGIYGEILFFIGLALILFFSDPKVGIFGRIGKGIWDLYNITGIFGDILSYIRLFALGVSSSILGFVVNDIGLQIKDAIPIIGPIIFVIFLIIGHGANMALSSLGSFVHPMRLTFVEFYKNSGFIGGGKKYKPFTKNF
ncbi:MAG: V-type ATP synthase subunit I [Hyphomicrobiales bacterium]